MSTRYLFDDLGDVVGECQRRKGCGFFLRGKTNDLQTLVPGLGAVVPVVLIVSNEAFGGPRTFYFSSHWSFLYVLRPLCGFEKSFKIKTNIYES